jgi:DNA primase
MLHQAGFTTAVATLGTALTNEHLPLLSRGNPRVILSYDGDEAGIAAALKASRLLSNHGIAGGVVIFKEGLDPADMVQRGEQAALAKLFDAPQPFVEFCLERTIKTYNLKDPLQKQRALEEATAFLKSLPPAVAASYQGMLADMLGLKETFVRVEKPKHATNAPRKRVFEDTLELTIIKTLLLEPSLIDTVLDIIDISMFKTHGEEFRALLDGRHDHPSLRRLLLWEDIKIYPEEELIGSLIHFLGAYYQEELERVKRASHLAFEAKSFLIRKIQHIMVKLKKGELVPYESFSTL